MATRDLRQSDLTEIGSQGVVSEVLTGKHELNARQIKRLAKRFQCLAGGVRLEPVSKLIVMSVGVRHEVPKPNNSADALGFALLGESESDHSFR